MDDLTSLTELFGPLGGFDDLPGFGPEEDQPIDLDALGFPPPDPALRQIPINLDALLDAYLENPAADAPPDPLVSDIAYFDTQTGTIPRLSGDPRQDKPMRKAIAADPDRYPQIPGEPDDLLRHDIDAYVTTVEDRILRRRFQTALAVANPIDRFLAVVNSEPDAVASWYPYSRRQTVSRLLAWLAEHGVAPRRE